MEVSPVAASGLAGVIEGPAAAAVARHLALIRKMLAGVLDFAPVFPRAEQPVGFAAPTRRAERLDADGVAGAVDLDLCDFLGALAKRMRSTLGRRIDIAMHVEAACPACRAEPHALEAAVLSLIKNAGDAMPRGGRLTFDIRSGALANGGPAVSISVCDDGMGMRPEVAQHAVDRFFTTKRGEPRAGLGLCAVEDFVCRSGGDMRMRTLAGFGTTVTLNLPCGSSG